MKYTDKKNGIKKQVKKGKSISVIKRSGVVPEKIVGMVLLSELKTTPTLYGENYVLIWDKGYTVYPNQNENLKWFITVTTPENETLYIGIDIGTDFWFGLSPHNRFLLKIALITIGGAILVSTLFLTFSSILKITQNSRHMNTFLQQNKEKPNIKKEEKIPEKDKVKEKEEVLETGIGLLESPKEVTLIKENNISFSNDSKNKVLLRYTIYNSDQECVEEFDLSPGKDHNWNAREKLGVGTHILQYRIRIFSIDEKKEYNPYTINPITVIIY